MGMRNKRGQIIAENVIFLVLNLIFLAILAIFLVNQSSGTPLLEDVYSKQIALLIDSAKPGMSMEVNLERAYEIAKEEGVPFEDVLKIDTDKNYVYFSLGDGDGRRYHFFNNVNVTEYSITVDEKEGYHAINIYSR